jgi:hypothetical protein
MGVHYFIDWDDPSDIPSSYPPEIVLKLFSEELSRRTTTFQGAAELMERSVLTTPVPVVKILYRNTRRMEVRFEKVQRYLAARQNPDDSSPQ